MNDLEQIKFIIEKKYFNDNFIFNDVIHILEIFFTID